MRRPINWFVFCLSLAFLFANVTLGLKPAPPEGQSAAPLPAQLVFSHVTVREPATTQFGYIRNDGSFLPLAQQPAIEPVVSNAPARF